MAGFLAALDMHICRPDVTDNTETSQHVLVWWSEKPLFMQYYLQKEKRRSALV